MSLLTKRSTIYFNPDIHKVLKLKSLETSRSLSDIVNEALMHELREDAEDLQEFKDRRMEDNLSFETVVANLEADGKI